MNTPEDLAPDVLARALEERGFDSLWVGEHTHIPTSRATPYPAGGEMPPQYRRMMDPYVSLMLAASATTTLSVGTAVALPLEHDLLSLAKTVATLDRLSGGRMQLGVGVGWNQEELANHRPTPWAVRYRVLAECVAALTALWTQDEPAYQGRYFAFDPVWSDPKPLQRPRPPVLCGTGGKLGTRNAVDWADGWMPMDIALGNVAKKIGLFRQAALAAGRTDMPITLVAWGDPPLERLAEYRDLGVARVVVGASRRDIDDPGTTLAFLDRYAAMIPELLGPIGQRRPNLPAS
jgi:probable F420-dependent oxidoreductase